MVINHNLGAINAQRNMGINSGAAAKSMEKLSSGLKINRAGDNAAGLSISEKMRAQIRGLDQASDNAEDGISMIQTAEGALNETHSILQRMRELAVQAGNDTNANIDREAIQAEIDQLSSEVNRIGNTTEFNTQKLLNGDKSNGVQTKVQGSEATKAKLENLKVGDALDVKVEYDMTGVEGNFEILFESDSTITGTGNGPTASWSDEGKLIVKLNSDTATENTMAAINAAIQASATGDTAAAIPHGLDVSKIKVSSVSRGTDGIDASAIVAKVDGNELKGATTDIVHDGTVKFTGLGANDLTITYRNSTTNDSSAYNDYKIVFADGTTAGAAIDDTAKTITITLNFTNNAADLTTDDVQAQLNTLSVAGTFTATTTVTADGSAVASNDPIGFTAVPSEQEISGGAATIWGTTAESKGIIGNANYKITTGVHNDLGNMKVEFVAGDDNAVSYDTGSDTLKIQLKKGSTVTQTQLNELLAQADNAATQTVSGATTLKDLQITIQLDEAIKTDEVKGLYGQEGQLSGGKTETQGVYTFSVDKQDVTIDGVKLAYSKDITNNTVQFNDVKSLASAINGNVELRNKYEASVTEDGNLQLTQKAGQESKDAPVVEGARDNSVGLQIGANENQSMSISIEDMRSQNLGITSTVGGEGFKATKSVNDGTNNEAVEYSLDVSNKTVAGKAITTIQNAINKVSAQRSSLGAYQNRLEHTINNLDNSSENLTAAESRIRDTDMAEEMSEYSKNNILQQAAQAMLAQAKSAPEQALQLLR